jgi:hypothetical protein
MKLKITHPSGDYLAGLEYEVPEKKALELIAADMAFEVVENKPKTKKVKNGNGQNDTKEL